MTKNILKNIKGSLNLIIVIAFIVAIAVFALCGIFIDNIFQHVLVASNKVMYKIAFGMGVSALIIICPLPFIKNKWVIIAILVIALLLSISSLALNLEGMKFNFH